MFHVGNRTRPAPLPCSTPRIVCRSAASNRSRRNRRQQNRSIVRRAPRRDLLLQRPDYRNGDRWQSWTRVERDVALAEDDLCRLIAEQLRADINDLGPRKKI